MPESPKPLRIFLSYAHADVLSVRKLHRYLREKGFDVWFDEERLFGGQDWRLEIEEGLNNSDVVIVCLSQTSVSREGFFQRESKFALDRALNMPEGRIFLIPVRLDNCKAPTRLSRYHWVDLFKRDGLQRLIRALKLRAEQLHRTQVDESQSVTIPDLETNPGTSLSVGQDVQGSAIILGNNNIINMIPPSQAQEEAAKRQKQTAEDERQAREKAEAQRIAEEQAKQERIAREKAEAERVAVEEAEKERLAKLKAENERLAREKAEQERLAREYEQAKRTAAQKAEKQSKAREKHERAQRAHAQTWASLRTPALLVGGLLLAGVGCLAIWWLVQGVFPFSASPTATLQVSATATPPPVTFTPAPPTEIPFTLTPTLTPTLAAGVMVSKKDGMKLHYVPAGPFMMGSETNDDEKPIHEVSLAAFWIDETEVTNKMYALCLKDAKCQPPGSKDSYTHKPYYGNPQFADYPVIYVSWNDATAYCSWAGRKLPTEAQWEKAARWKPSPAGGGQGGGESLIYPWGNAAPDNNLLNYYNSLHDTTKVGSYPNGKSFYGAQDMAGNVWEWVNDWYSDIYYASSPSTNPTGPDSGQYRVLRGGSWGDYDVAVRSAVRVYDEPVVRKSVLGFRCALPSINAPTPIPVSILTPAARDVMISEKDGMKLHYVPAGSFTMGSSGGEADEKPEHEVTLDAFWIDETEVTNQMYAQCVKDSKCQPPGDKSSYTRDSYYDDAQYADYPVVYVLWNDATAYCSWTGRRLPTEAEWEKAARGPNGNIYPWGNNAPDNNLLNYNNTVGDTTKVGWYPNGSSFYGAQDMAGNVWEWVNDWYDVYPGGNPNASSSFGQKYRVLRGGSWGDHSLNYVRSANRDISFPDNGYNYVGFRCALSP